MNHLEALIQAIPAAVFAGATTPAFNAIKSAAESVNAPLNYPNFPAGVPPPSLHAFPLTNPSTHFTAEPKAEGSSPTTAFNSLFNSNNRSIPSPDQFPEDTSRMPLSASYLYVDDEGYTRWQGETSGLPLLDLLLERHSVSTRDVKDGSPQPQQSDPSSPASSHHHQQDWFPNRTSHRADANPQILWRLITSYIVPELMDRYVTCLAGLPSVTEHIGNSLVQCYLSTSYYILPFLHVPTFLSVCPSPCPYTTITDIKLRTMETHKNGVNQGSPLSS